MILGIDLGTSNSAVAIWRDGKPQLIPNSLGELLTPSAVSIDKDGAVIVGRAARDLLVTRPEHTATAFKRYMGSTRSVMLGKRSFLPEELSALVLRSLKADAESFLGEPVTEAVITVPAYFNDKQRKATRKAGELAGLKVERLLNEPTAAALAYGIHKLDSRSQFLVFDLGGGTFDVSILEIFEGIIEVRATTGDNRLGGEDFNELLVDAMFAAHAKAWKVARKEDNASLYQLVRDASERARRQLTTESRASMVIIWKGAQYCLEIDQQQFEKMTEGLLVRLKEPVIRALRDSSIQPEQIEQIVLAGGATRMPIVRQSVTRMFGRFPATHLNPDEVVALGASVQAGLKMRDVALKEVVLTDVCPYSLGVGIGERGPDNTIRDGIFEPIIERNTVIPASRSKVFVTLQDRQTAVRFNVYQGESRHVKNNIHLGSVEIAVPPRPAHEVQVECRFTYDINGLLEVDVYVPTTQDRRQQVIIGSEAMDPRETEERRRMLASLKVHPRETAENVAALARAARCYEQQLGERRDYVGRLLSAFERVLEQQDPRAIEHAREMLHTELDELEGQRLL